MAKQKNPGQNKSGQKPAKKLSNKKAKRFLEKLHKHHEKTYQSPTRKLVGELMFHPMFTHSGHKGRLDETIETVAYCYDGRKREKQKEAKILFAKLHRALQADKPAEALEVLEYFLRQDNYRARHILKDFLLHRELVATVQELFETLAEEGIACVLQVQEEIEQFSISKTNL